MGQRPSKPKKPACSKCGDELVPRTVNVVPAACWSCGGSMKIAFGDHSGVALNPPNFTEAEIEAALRAGAKLEIRHSKTTGTDYRANVCPHCNKITGDFYLHDFWHDATPENEVARTLGCVACIVDEEESQD